MKSHLKFGMAMLAFGAILSSAMAEERAPNNDKPRDCSKIEDATRKTRCEAFNRALEACKGKKVGEELNACLIEKGKKKG